MLIARVRSSYLYMNYLQVVQVFVRPSVCRCAVALTGSQCAAVQTESARGTRIVYAIKLSGYAGGYTCVMDITRTWRSEAMYFFISDRQSKLLCC